MNLVYAAEYNPMTYESSYGVISLHETFNGALEAIEKHRKTVQYEYDEMTASNNFGYVFKIESWEDWRVREIEVEK